MVKSKGMAAWTASLLYLSSICLLPMFASVSGEEEQVPLGGNTHENLGTVIGIDLGTTYS
jgi:hypothetical protein